MVAALEVEHLTVRFGATEILRDLSFSVEAASSLAIIGPNGAGKTVLFRALIGAVPHAGRVSWAPGTRIGYVPQKLDLERDLPVRGVDFLRAKAAVTRAPAGAAQRALDLVRLAPGAVDKPIGNLSGGQFQRLLVAVALVGAPTVLLLDEPTAGVDEPGQEHLNETLERLRERESLDCDPHLARLERRLPLRDQRALPLARRGVLRRAAARAHARRARVDVRLAGRLPRAPRPR